MGPGLTSLSDRWMLCAMEMTFQIHLIMRSQSVRNDGVEIMHKDIANNITIRNWIRTSRVGNGSHYAILNSLFSLTSIYVVNLVKHSAINTSVVNIHYSEIQQTIAIDFFQQFATNSVSIMAVKTRRNSL